MKTSLNSISKVYTGFSSFSFFTRLRLIFYSIEYNPGGSSKILLPTKKIASKLSLDAPRDLKIKTQCRNPVPKLFFQRSTLT